MCEFLNFEGVKIIYYAAEQYSKDKDTMIFTELVQFINDPIFDIKINAMKLFNVMLKKSNESNFQAKLIQHFNEIDLNSTLKSSAP